MSGFAASSTRRFASAERSACSWEKPRRFFKLRNSRVIASSAACPGSTRQRLTRNSTSIDSKRNYVVRDPGTAGLLPSGFERKGISLYDSMYNSPSCASASLTPESRRPRYSRNPLSASSRRCVPLGLFSAARIPGSGLTGASQTRDPGLAGVTQDKEFSCRKNWLFPRPPTNGGSRFWKKVS
jgi:hypothetical protein